MTNGVWLVVSLTAMAFAVPGPCSYDAHEELDCRGGDSCPEGLACARDGFCKPEDVACDTFDEDDFPGGLEVCDGACVPRDQFQTDVENCGGCGEVCAPGLGCCDGACVALDTNENCGACERVCAAELGGPGSTCVDGDCRAGCGVDADCDGAGEVCCDGVCRDGTVDTLCGACDVACGSDEACVDQVCVAVCGGDGDCPGSRCCGGFCVAPGDPAHCGACDASCGADTVCLDDACAPECAEDRPCAGDDACCGGRCVDTNDDDDHCGACDAPCAGTTFCNDGTCRTGTERDCCGSACVDCGGEACVDRTCQSCDIYEQNCGPLASCGFSPFGGFPPDGTCSDALPPPAPDRHETCATGCLEGLDCNAFVTSEAICVAYCDPGLGDDGCAADERCLPQELGEGFVLGICIPRCDLGTTACTFGDRTGTCIPIGAGCTGPEGICIAPGDTPEGGTCQVLVDCAQGLVCDAGTCRAVCRDVDTACAGGTCGQAFACDELGVCR